MDIHNNRNWKLPNVSEKRVLNLRTSVTLKTCFICHTNLPEGHNAVARWWRPALTVQKSNPIITGVLMSDYFQGIYSRKQVNQGKPEFFSCPSGLYCFGPVMLFVPLLHLCLLGLGKVLFVDFISPRFTFSRSRMHNFIGCFPDFPYISQVSTVLLYMCFVFLRDELFN